MAQFDSKNAAAPINQMGAQSTGGAPPLLSKRRRFLQALGGAVTGLGSTAGMGLLAPGSTSAQTQLTPEEALAELLAGNKRFVDGKMTSFGTDLAILRHHTSEKQQPFAAVLSCADSRVPVEIVFDQTIGQIFVTRDAGNVVTSEIVASLEYGAAVLKVKVILVMGHSHCGAVEAAIEGGEAPGEISALYPHLQPAVDIAGPDIELTVRENAKIQASLLRRASTVISALVKDHHLLVVPAFYDIASGVVTLLEYNRPS